MEQQLMAKFKDSPLQNTITSPFEYSSGFGDLLGEYSMKQGVGQEETVEDTSNQKAMTQGVKDGKNHDPDDFDEPTPIPRNYMLPMAALGYGEDMIRRIIANGGRYRQVLSTPKMDKALGFDYMQGMNNLQLSSKDVLQWLKKLEDNVDMAIRNLDYEQNREEYRHFYMSLFFGAFLELLSFYSSTEEYIPPSKVISQLASIIKPHVKKIEEEEGTQMKAVTLLANFIDLNEYGKSKSGYAKMYSICLANPDNNDPLKKICPPLFILNDKGKAHAFTSKADALKYLKKTKESKMKSAFKTAFAPENRVNTIIIVMSIGALAAFGIILFKIHPFRSKKSKNN